MRLTTLPAALAMTALALATPIASQKASLTELATQLSGTWKVNRSLSPALAMPGQSGAGRSRGTFYAVGGSVPQRGGRGGGNADPGPAAPGDLTPTELAERGAVRQLEQISPTITIAASPETVSFVDSRGELSCATDDKGVKHDLFGASVSVKCRWDKQQLRQEFATTRSKLVRSWSVDGNGRLVLKARLEGLTQSTPEAVAVFDRS